MTSIPAYDIGDQLRLGNHSGENDDGTERGAFTTIDGTPLNPTTVSLALWTPAGVERVYNFPTQGGGDGVLIQAGTGRFYVDVSLADAGLWHWGLSSTGSVATAERGAFYVRRSTIE